MFRPNLRLLAASAALFAVSLCRAQAQEPPPLPAGTKAPAFATTTVGGKPLSLKALRGKVVLLDYWATWCGPCRMATPTLEALHKKYARRGLTVVGMNMDDQRTVAQIKPFIQQFGITYKVTGMTQANFTAAQAYNVHGIPSQYLIDRKGRVRWSQGGYSRDEPQTLDALIAKLLAEKA